MYGFHTYDRPSAMEWAQSALLAGNLAWTTLCLGGYRAETMIVTSTLTGALLLVHALATWPWPAASEEVAAGAGRARSHGTARPLHRAGWFFTPFLVYAAANVLWVTPVPWLGWADWFGWAQMAVVFWVTLNGLRSRGSQRFLLGSLFLVAVAGVVLGCHQQFIKPDWLMLNRIQADQYLGRASGSFGIPNSFAALLLLLIPLAVALAARRGATAVQRVFHGWLALVLLFGLGLTISRGAWLSLGIALAAWPLLSSTRSWRGRASRSLLAVAGIAVLVAGTYALSPKVRERVTSFIQDAGERSRPILWRAAWQMIRAHPGVGTGAGSYDVMFERHRPEGFANVPQWAHNEYLNTWSDYGSIGFVLFFGAAGLTLAAALPRRRDRAHDRISDGGGAGLAQPHHETGHGRWSTPRPSGDVLDDALVRQSLGIGLLAFALQMAVDFHFKIPALAMAFSAVSGIAVSRAPAHSGFVMQPVARRAAAVVMVAMAVATGVFVVPRYRAEGLRQSAREAIDMMRDESPASEKFKRRIAQACVDLTRAIELAPENAQAWSDRSHAQSQLSRSSPDELVVLGRLAEEDANWAITIGPLVAEFWVRRGVARDMQGRWAEAGNDFTHAITLSPARVLAWYHYAYHLSLQPAGRDLAGALVAFCLRLDPQNYEALALRQQLAAVPVGP